MKARKSQRKKLYLRTDELEDTINALEHCAYMAKNLGKLANWKWCLISIHNALQGSLVCALSGTANIGAFDDSSRRQWLNFLETSRNNTHLTIPKDRLADLMTLVDRAGTKRWMNEFGGEPIAITPQVRRDVRRLNSLRNDFIHFKPQGWSLELVGLPRILLNACSLIEPLLLSHPANTHRLKKTQISRIKRTLRALRKTLMKKGC